VALTLRTPTEAEVFEQEQRRQRQTEQRETNSGKRTRKILKKAGMRNVEKGKETSPEKALVQIRSFLEPLVQKSRKR